MPPSTSANAATSSSSNTKSTATPTESSYSTYSPYNSRPLTAFKSTDVPQFDALRDAAIPFVRSELHLRNLCNDSTRCLALRATYVSDNDFRRIILDYSRQQVTGEIMELLFDLADAVGFATRQKVMQEEGVVSAPGSSTTPVLQHILRMPMKGDVEFTAGLHAADNDSTNNCNPWINQEILPEVRKCRLMVEDFTNLVRSGQHVGVTGKPLRNVLVVSDSVSRYGTECVYDALQRDVTAKRAAQGRVLRFCTNVNPVEFETQVHDLDPSETLVVVILNQHADTNIHSGRNEDDGEELAVLYNARSAEKWLIQNLTAVTDVDADFSDTVGSPQSSFELKRDLEREKLVLSKHMVAVTSSRSKLTTSRANNYNDSNYLASLVERIEHVFDIGDYILNRFAVWSVIGLLPLSLQFSTVVTNQLLAGAHDLDHHFFQSPLRDNIPVLLGLLGVWNSTFLGYGVRAVLPYGLSNKFAAWVGQMDMESNGKHVAMDGEPLLHYSSAEITICANPAIYQILHQGRVIPTDFVGFMESQLQQQPKSIQHDRLMSHFFAQPDALAYGITMTELVQESVPEELRPHKYLSGNRPSSSLLLSKLDAFGLGQLMAIYEHRTAVQGFLWGISSFDHTHGSELANKMSQQIHYQLHYTRTTGASVQGFNPSTSTLLEEYLKHESTTTTTTTLSSPTPTTNHGGGPIPYS